VKRLLFIILFVSGCFLLSARRDSTRFTSFQGFYINTYYAHFEGGIYRDYYQKFPIDEEQFYYNGEKYYSQSPALGIGGIMSLKGLFIKGDVNYWYGSKAINYRSSHSYTTDGQLADPISWYQAYPAGTKYSRTEDHLRGKLNINHLDISFALTGNISRNFRIYLGLRLNYIISHNLKAKLERTTRNYEVLYKTSEYSSHDTLLSTTYDSFSDNEIEKAHSINVDSKTFINFGFCFNFRIKKQLFMTDLVMEKSSLKPFNNYGFVYSAVTFKLSYVFSYSTRFGKKKFKD
jgi:hypothetical protein